MSDSPKTTLIPEGQRELLSILNRGFESKDLDYKGPCKWEESEKKTCCALVKDILAMANTLGGFIVIGVSENPSGFTLDGLSGEQNASFDTSRVNRFTQNYSDPPVNALLKKIEQDGKIFVVIEVPQFPDTPHICQKDFPGVLSAGALYVRSDNNESVAIRSSADFRLLVEQAVRNRTDFMLKAMRTILKSGSIEPLLSNQIAATPFEKQREEAIASFAVQNPLKDKKYEGYREVSFSLDTFSPDRFTIDQLRVAAHSASVSFTGWPFLFISGSRTDVTGVIQDGLETLVSTKDFGDNDMLDFWRFQQSGFFYHRTLMWEDAQAAAKGLDTKTAGTGGIATHAAEAVNCLTNLYRDLVAKEEKISLSLRMYGTQNRKLVSPSRMLSGNYVSRIPEIRVDRTYALADWRAGIVDHALEITKEIYLRFNWQNPNIETARNYIDKLFARSW